MMKTEKPEIEPFFGYSRRGYLQMLCNKYGNFRVARGWKGADGEIRWTKHRSVLECWESDEGLAFLDAVNNRTQLECEIRLDTDPQPNETPEESLAIFNKICDHIESLGDYSNYRGFFSGSRGYHVHILVPELMRESEQRRKELKVLFMKRYEAELLKASNHTMLTLEWADNNKTGKQKISLRGGCIWLEEY